MSADALRRNAAGSSFGALVMGVCVFAASLMTAMPVRAQGLESQNLARSPQATASQSSSLADGGAARLAIDGNTHGNWANGSVVHTGRGQGETNQPWWQVDLGRVGGIHTIRLFNRTDCCGFRMSNFHVFVSDVPFTGSTVAASQAQQGTSDYPTSGQMGTPTEIDIGRNGRYVRVQLAGNGQPVNMAEVEVLGGEILTEIPVVDSTAPRPGTTLST